MPKQALANFAKQQKHVTNFVNFTNLGPLISLKMQLGPLISQNSTKIKKKIPKKKSPKTRLLNFFSVPNYIFSEISGPNLYFSEINGPKLATLNYQKI